MLLTEQAVEYAELLQNHGFRVFAYRPDRAEVPPARWFYYSHVVKVYGGTTVTCWGYVEIDRWGNAKHSMPIEPSVYTGSSLVIVDDPTVSKLSVEYAKSVARPTNRGKWFPETQSFPNRNPLRAPNGSSELVSRFGKHFIDMASGLAYDGFNRDRNGELVSE